MPQSSAIATVAMVHGLRGDTDHQLWHSRALTVARSEDATQSPERACTAALAGGTAAPPTASHQEVGFSGR
jgi:hypothetical protein